MSRKEKKAEESTQEIIQNPVIEVTTVDDDYSEVLEESTPETIEEPIIEVTTIDDNHSEILEESIEEIQESNTDAPAQKDIKKYEFTVSEFFFRGKKYLTKTLEIDHPEILEKLLETNSFIIKKS